MEILEFMIFSDFYRTVAVNPSPTNLVATKEYSYSGPRSTFVFRSIVGHHLVKSPNFVEIKKGKGIWQEQSLI